MATYKFPQFNSEIVNPTVTVNDADIKINVPDMSISLPVTLETDNSKLYGVELSDIPADNLNYEGESNLMSKAMEALEQYEVK